MVLGGQEQFQYKGEGQARLYRFQKQVGFVEMEDNDYKYVSRNTFVKGRKEGKKIEPESWQRFLKAKKASREEELITDRSEWIRITRRTVFFMS